MLTKDLLEYRIQRGHVKPTFVDRDDPALLALADALVSVVESMPNAERGELEEAADRTIAGFEKPRIAQGLVKLLFDRLEFEEPDDTAVSRRAETFARAATLFRALPDGAAPEDFETILQREFQPDLASIRDRLYADHPEHRKALAWRAITGQQLVDRYNLGLVQGLVLRASRVTVSTDAAHVLEVRRLLRWLKFQRLVVDVTKSSDGWTLDVEGPAAILDMQRKYGLQLAQFVAVVPVLGHWSLKATIRFERGKPAELLLDEHSPLRTPHDQALGHVPEEIGVITAKLEDETWRIEPLPTPRRVGTGALCMPDLVLVHRTTGREVAFEFFHRWHRHQLHRRLEELKIRPDPTLLLAVDEALLDDELFTRAQAEAHPQVVLFKGFPSEKKLRAALAKVGT